MKTGTQTIIYKIEDVLFHNHIKSKRRIARQIWEAIEPLIGDDMSKKDFDLAYNFPQELNPIVQQLERGLGVSMMKDEKAIEVYRWLAEQGREKIKVFIGWATDSERVQFIGKYRRSPGLIRVEWKEAFKPSASNQRTSLLETLSDE